MQKQILSFHGMCYHSKEVVSYCTNCTKYLCAECAHQQHLSHFSYTLPVRFQKIARLLAYDRNRNSSAKFTALEILGNVEQAVNRCSTHVTLDYSLDTLNEAVKKARQSFLHSTEEIESRIIIDSKKCSKMLGFLGKSNGTIKTQNLSEGIINTTKHMADFLNVKQILDDIVLINDVLNTRLLKIDLHSSLLFIFFQLNQVVAKCSRYYKRQQRASYESYICFFDSNYIHMIHPDTLVKMKKFKHKKCNIDSDCSRSLVTSDSRIFVCGSVIEPLNSTYEFLHSTNAFVDRESMIVGRYFHSFIAYKKNFLLAIGGETGHCEAYNIEKDSWIKVSSMMNSRSFHL